MHLSSRFGTSLAGQIPPLPPRYAEGNTFGEALAKEKWKNGGWNVRYRKREKETSSLQARLAFGACLIVCFSSIIQRRPLALGNQTRDGRRGPRRLRSTALENGSPTISYVSSYSRFEQLFELDSRYLFRAQIYLVQYRRVLIRYRTPREYRQTFAC